MDSNDGQDYLRILTDGDGSALRWVNDWFIVWNRLSKKCGECFQNPYLIVGV